jgi:hypothetical protein
MKIPKGDEKNPSNADDWSTDSFFRRAVPFRPKALKKLTKREEESLFPLPIYVSVVNLLEGRLISLDALR